MSDVIFIAVLIVFFVLCTLYVHLCDRLMGSDELAMAGQGAERTPGSDAVSLTTSSTATSVEVAL
jgi:hypothetical protein